MRTRVLFTYPLSLGVESFTNVVVFSYLASKPVFRKSVIDGPKVVYLTTNRVYCSCEIVGGLNFAFGVQKLTQDRETVGATNFFHPWPILTLFTRPPSAISFSFCLFLSSLFSRLMGGQG